MVEVQEMDCNLEFQGPNQIKIIATPGQYHGASDSPELQRGAARLLPSDASEASSLGTDLNPTERIR